jgi:hypothetical protein
MSFDVLNPDYSTDKFKSIVATVTTTFKNLFIQSCPGCRAFNIRDFKVRHIAVPKFNFRYFVVENNLHLHNLFFHMYSYVCLHVEILICLFRIYFSFLFITDMILEYLFYNSSFRLIESKSKCFQM